MTDSDTKSLFERMIDGEIPADVVHDDERVMIVLGERLQTILEDLAGMPDGDDGASPVS